MKIQYTLPTSCMMDALVRFQMGRPKHIIIAARVHVVTKAAIYKITKIPQGQLPENIGSFYSYVIYAINVDMPKF